MCWGGGAENERHVYAQLLSRASAEALAILRSCDPVPDILLAILFLFLFPDMDERPLVPMRTGATLLHLRQSHRRASNF